MADRTSPEPEGDQPSANNDANPEEPSAPETAPEAAPEAAPAAERRAECMFVARCTTGSTLRKIISHIFGRNKTCTRDIPEHVWVHFCRKHYQRCRYRSALQFALQQIDLVITQIRMVDDWSEENRRRGQRAGILQYWTLQPRKREAQRLRDKTSKKRPLPNDDNGSDEEEEDSAALNGTAIPQWLLNRCNQNYTTAEITEIAREIHRAMNNGQLPQIPDIEILPTITRNTNEKPKTYGRRKTAGPKGGNSHKRSQSANTISTRTSELMNRRDSHISGRSMNNGDHPSFNNRVEKRPRLDDTYEEPYSAPSTNRYGGRLHDSLAFRPQMTNINEDVAADDYHASQQQLLTGSTPQPGYGGSIGGSNPAPYAQQHGLPLEGQHGYGSSGNGYVPNNRPVHQRSHSEFSSFPQGPLYGTHLTPSYPPGHPSATQNGYSSFNTPATSSYGTNQEYAAHGFPSHDNLRTGEQQNAAFYSDHRFGSQQGTASAEMYGHYDPATGTVHHRPRQEFTPRQGLPPAQNYPPREEYRLPPLRSMAQPDTQQLPSLMSRDYQHDQANQQYPHPGPEDHPEESFPGRL
ncbi:Orp1 like protein [Pleurostoma richardsiae]|uniref:Orp1 like protein n=1 Tax=Pleurostoma richardsiae TaxID=41990 RepID=A0AA38S571_9PEZI|nr:Orp1 like protein [Pleurostoma richardsiae]